MLKYFSENEITVLGMHEFIPAFEELLAYGEKVFIISGWLTSGGLRLVVPSIVDGLKQGREISLLVGKQFTNDDYSVAINLISEYKELFHFKIGNPREEFIHAKVYAAYCKGDVLLLSGSSNLTCNGMTENIEWNTTAKISGKTSLKIRESIEQIWSSGIEYDSTPNCSYGRKDYSMAQNNEKILRSFREYDIKKWDYKKISKDVKGYQQKILTFIEEVEGNKIDPSTFKKEYLFEENWAITESEGWTSLKENIHQEDPKQITNRIITMLNNASRGLEPDKVFASGRIPNVLGESILTEILHKAYPSHYPILNRKSAFGFLILLDRDFQAHRSQSLTPYKNFIAAVDEVVELWRTFLENDKKLITDLIKYRCVDMLCQYIYEDEANKPLRTIWNKSE